MAEHHYRPERYYNTIGSHEPVLRVEDGDTIMTTTLDVRGQDHTGTVVATPIIPMTGPFHVEGALPGDMLEVVFNHIRPNRPWGFAKNVLASNIVEPQDAALLPAMEIVRWTVDAATGMTRLESPPPALAGLELPIHPYIGCFGVAPARDQAILAVTAGDYGGNMDYRGFTAGSSAYFPVFSEGGLFYMGDGHATQGDGEVVGTGIEISMDVSITVKVHKAKKILWPRGQSDTHIFTLGNARPLDQALQHATSEMLRWLKDDYGLTTSEASILLSQTVEYDIANVCNPAYTMVCKLNKRHLPR